MKKLLTILLMLSIMSYAAESKSITIKDNKPLTLNKELTPYNLTIKELKNFNGKEGKKAFIAVDGTIYDVTDIKAWKNGKHKGNEAGEDVSETINKAPHGDSVLKKLTIVGKLLDKPTKE